MRKKAVIIGSKGQDGTLLFEFLTKKDYDVVGIDIDVVQSNRSEFINKGKINIFKSEEVNSLISCIKPDEVYYLAAYHHSSEDQEISTKELVEKSYQINVCGLVNFLEAIKENSLKSKIFYASSSLVFGDSAKNPQTEETPLEPSCVYGITKVSAMQLCRFYKERFSMFVSIGILYNHESHLRKENFISQKIISSVKRIKEGLQDELVVGDLNAETDWGYAGDYVEAMWSILQIDIPETFIVATGKTHCVEDWIRLSFENVGLNWEQYVREDSSLLKRKKAILVGDSSKLFRYTGWEPKTSFEEMVSLMMRN